MAKIMLKQNGKYEFNGSDVTGSFELSAIVGQKNFSHIAVKDVAGALRHLPLVFSFKKSCIVTDVGKNPDSLYQDTLTMVKELNECRSFIFNPDFGQELAQVVEAHQDLVAAEKEA